MPDYVTVYQISSGTSGLPFALVGLAPLAVGLTLILGKWRLHWHRPGWLFAGFSCAFGILWMFLASGPVLIEGSDAFTAFQTGRYSGVEARSTVSIRCHMRDMTTNALPWGASDSVTRIAKSHQVFTMQPRTVERSEAASTFALLTSAAPFSGWRSPELKCLARRNWL